MKKKDDNHIKALNEWRKAPENEGKELVSFAEASKWKRTKDAKIKVAKRLKNLFDDGLIDSMEEPDFAKHSKTFLDKLENEIKRDYKGK